MKYVKNKKGEIVAVRCTSKKDGNFFVPIFDVRRNRGIAELAVKSSNIANGSKFMRPSYSVLGYKYQ